MTGDYPLAFNIDYLDLSLRYSGSFSVKLYKVFGGFFGSVGVNSRLYSAPSDGASDFKLFHFLCDFCVLKITLKRMGPPLLSRAVNPVINPSPG